MNEKLKRALEALAAACQKRDAAFNEIEEAADDLPDEDVTVLHEAFDEAQADVERCKKEKERLERIIEARNNSPLPELPVDGGNGKDGEKRHARERGSSKDELAYRPDKMGETSFFRDLLAVKSGDREARDRMDRNREASADAWYEKTGVDYRDMQNLTTQGSEFIPTVYLNDLWVHPSIAGRPFADALQKYPLPATGTTLSMPKLSSGVTVAGRADAGTVSETDGVTASVTFDVNELAGQVDIGRVAVFRSEPGLDQVIGSTLVRRYNAKLDTDCISGSGTAPAHKGLDNLTSPNTRSYTDGSPTAAELLPVVWNGAADIATNRSGEVIADTILMHHRRAAFLGGGLSSTFPLFQQGGLFQAAGTQDNTMVTSMGGLRVILDANITITAGASTNEDKIYVLASSDFYLAEGPLFSRVFEDVGSGNGLIRYQIFAYSAFLGNRYPKSLCIISGTGLTAPS